MTSNKPRGKHAKPSKDDLDLIDEPEQPQEKLESPLAAAHKKKAEAETADASSPTELLVPVAPEPVAADVEDVDGVAEEDVAAEEVKAVEATDTVDAVEAVDDTAAADTAADDTAAADTAAADEDAAAAADTAADDEDAAAAADTAADDEDEPDSEQDASSAQDDEDAEASIEAPASAETIALPAVESDEASADTVALDAVDSPFEPSFSEQETVAFGAAPQIGVVSPMQTAYMPASGDASGFTPDGDWQNAPMGYVPEFDLSKKRRRKAGKVVAITLGAIVGVIALVYVAGVFVFSNWMLPNTKIGDLDVSLKSSDEVAEIVESEAAKYTLDVLGSGFSYRTDAKGVGLKVDSYGVVEAIHQDLPSWKWPALIIEPVHDETECYKTTYSPTQYQEDVKKAVATFNETATPPTNAMLEYDQPSNTFRVKPEVPGTQLDPDAVLEAMGEGIESLSSKVQLGESELLKPAVLSTDKKLNDAAQFATGMVSASIELHLNGQPVGNVGPDELAQFVMMDENYGVSLNEVLLYDWIAEQSNNFNTIGSERVYTRADGKVIGVAGGSYGWEVDVEALKNAIVENVKTGASSVIDIPCMSTAATFAGKGARDWGNRYIDVDLSEQYVRFYGDDGSIIWESACISGRPDGEHDTSTGVYYITDKRSPAKLIGYENGVKIYESDVTYWMPFVGNAIGLHDADWQPGFGGTMYADGYGSHGCVNLPPYLAAELFWIVSVGDVVVSHW